MLHMAGERADPTVGELVLRALGDLTPSERRVAHVLLATYPTAGLETVARLAERAGVSGPTVMRFVGKLGFTGFPELQEALRREVQARISSPLTLYGRRPRGEEGMLASARERFVRSLDATFRAISPADFEAVTDLLADHRRTVLCTGGRHSQVLAYALHAHLHMLRPGTRFVGPGPAPRVDELVDVGPRTVLAVFDYRRYQRDTIEFALAAAERGADVVLFTDHWLSPIAEVARHVLPSSVEAASPFDTLVPALALVEALAAALLIRLGERARRRMERLEEGRVGFTWGEEAARAALPEGGAAGR